MGKINHNGIPTPPEFFTEVLVCQNPNVSKLVGAVIRHTLGQGADEWDATRDLIMQVSGIRSAAGLTSALLEARTEGFIVQRNLEEGGLSLRLRWQGEPADIPTALHGFTGDLSGYVYILQCGDRFKIGASKNPERRARDIGNVIGQDVSLQHTISADDMYGAERALHEYFADLRLNGEWFNLTERDLVDVKQLHRYECGAWYRGGL